MEIFVARSLGAAIPPSIFVLSHREPGQALGVFLCAKHNRQSLMVAKDC
jgi:hypothetical protein